jgi:hypothetical protein
MAEIAPGGEKEFFDLLFRWFLVPHELTHFLQTEFRSPANHYFNEVVANDVAVAFWKEQPEGPAQLARLRTIVGRAVVILPLPPEAKDNPAEYFNREYDRLGQNPRAYGAFQFRFILDSLERQESLRLELLLARLLP